MTTHVILKNESIKSSNANQIYKFFNSRLHIQLDWIVMEYGWESNCCKYLANFICLPETAVHYSHPIIHHDDVIKWKQFPRYWPLVRGIPRPPVNSPHKSQWRGALMFSLIYAWTNGWVNNRDAGNLRRHCVHYYIIVMNKTFCNTFYGNTF